VYLLLVLTVVFILSPLLGPWPPVLLFPTLALIFLLGPVVGVWPPVLRGPRTRSTLAFVTLRPPEWYAARGIMYRAVLAGQVAQWWVRWMVSFALAFPSTWVRAYPYQWALTIGSLLAASLWAELFPAQLRLLSTAVEVVAAEQPDYLTATAARLKTESRGFETTPVAQLESRIAARLRLARVIYAVVRRRVDSA
jgi:hypothetical protein